MFEGVVLCYLWFDWFDGVFVIVLIDVEMYLCDVCGIDMVFVLC